ncbi:MAG: RNA 2',3'-cyclic phosphodiesterase [Ignavibacteria bacterium]|nr:RNA 2',3'-cyclic phosphodiesterase [Ignavibacteria bacterium]
MKLRLFFAVNFDDEIKRKFYEISSQLRKFNEPVKYEPVEKLHLTLLFLGNVDENLLSELDRKALEISKNFSSSELFFDKLGVFKNFHQPRVIWIGTKDNPILKELSFKLKMMTNDLNIMTDEKEFSPHITLGRVKGRLSEKFIDFLKSFSFEPFTAKVNSFELMESKLEPSGSKYFVKSSYILQVKQVHLIRSFFIKISKNYN